MNAVNKLAPVRRFFVLAAAITQIVALAMLTPAVTQEVAPAPRAVNAANANDAGSSQDAEKATSPTRMVIHATDKETGKPLSGVAIRFRIYFDQATTKQGMSLSNKKGEAIVKLPSEPRVRRLRMDARAQGMVPYRFDRNSQNGAINLPAEYSMPFEKAATIGGVVRDAQGNPIQGALVDISYPSTDSDLPNYYYTLANNVKTNAEGRWTTTTVPKEFSGATLRVEHPDFLRTQVNVAQNATTLADESFELVLQQGLQVAGQVLDSVGKPVAGASVLLGTSRYDSNKQEATTDPQGRFVLKNCQQGPQFMCVTADGHAPDLQQMNVAGPIDALEIRLAPPATLRLRVLDSEGRPVAGAEPVPEQWRGQQMLTLRKKVDADGRWVWQSAPHDEVRFSILAGKEHLTMRNVALTPSDDEQIITVHPKFRIMGKVTDAATGEPVKEFLMLSAFQVEPQFNWNRYNPATFKDGEYEFKFDDMLPGYALRIEADGYQAAETPKFTATDAPDEIDFLLHKQGVIVGKVQKPDGSPAVGATVVLLTGDRGNVYFSDGRMQRNPNVLSATTGDDGRYRFNGPTDVYMLVALHDSGYEEELCEPDDDAPTLKLHPWGRIEGLLKIGSRPGAGQPIGYTPPSPQVAGKLRVMHSYNVETDGNGHFRIERVVPSEGWLSNQHIIKHVNGSTLSLLQSKTIQVESGETTKVELGGSGRPVLGRVVVKGLDYADYQWNLNEPARATTRQATNGAMRQTFHLPFAADGTFRGDDLPAGQYQLTISLTPPAGGNQVGFGQPVGTGSVTFTIPEMPGGRSDEPLDLGEIPITVQPAP